MFGVLVYLMLKLNALPLYIKLYSLPDDLEALMLVLVGIVERN